MPVRRDFVEELVVRFNVKAFAIACSLWWGFGIFFVTWWVIMWDGATGEPTILSAMYRGLNYSAQGSFIGLGWGLADGFIGGWIFAWMYNWLADRFSPKA